MPFPDDELDEDTLTDPIPGQRIKSDLSPQERFSCACPRWSTAVGCMQVRHPTPPCFGEDDGPSGMAGSEDPEEECPCICHVEEEVDDE